MSRCLAGLYVSLSASGVLVNILAAMQDRSNRRINVNAPGWLTQNDITYWPLLTCAVVVLGCLTFYAGA